jgi:sulfur-carrier protein
VPPSDASPAPRPGARTTARGTLRYWAAARAAAGVAEEPYCAATLAEALDAARQRHPGEFARILGLCSFVVDGDPVGRRAAADVPLRDGGTVEVLPPFAGG